MKLTFKGLIVALITIASIIGNYSSFAQCHEYIKQNESGEVTCVVSYETQQTYVELFIRYNGEQHSTIHLHYYEEYDATTNTYVYGFTHPAGVFEIGKPMTCRFYSYEAGKPGVFLPGPSEGVWSEPSIVGDTNCDEDNEPATCQALIETYDNKEIEIKSLDNGDVVYAITYTETQTYVEVFGRQNGLQNIAQNIVASEVINDDATVTYSLTRSASDFTEGDKISIRFYSYLIGVPGQNFTPGADPSVWSGEFTYSTECENILYVTTWGDDSNEGTIMEPLATIQYALDIAAGEDVDAIKIAAGTYGEVNLEIVEGVDVLGGYSQDFAERDITNSDPNFETIIDPDIEIPWGYTGKARVFTAFEIHEPTLIEGIHMTNGCTTPSGYLGGGNMLILRCDENLVIQHNLIDYGAVVGYQSFNYGGNMYISQSTCKILNNVIVHGYSYFGAYDLLVDGNYQGNNDGPEVAYNVFTNSTYSVSAYSGDFHDNTFLNQTRKGAAREVSATVENNILNVETQQPEQVIVEIYSISGSYISTVKGTDKISLLNLTQGIYLTRIQASEGVTTKKIFIK